jgi:fatty-acid desaturase
MCGLVRKGTWKKRGSFIVEGEYKEKWRVWEERTMYFTILKYMEDEGYGPWCVLLILFIFLRFFGCVSVTLSFHRIL